MAGQIPVFGCFEALFGLPEPDFHSASVGGATFEGSLTTFLRDLDGVGELFVTIFLPGTAVKIKILLIETPLLCNLLFSFFLDDPVYQSYISHTHFSILCLWKSHSQAGSDTQGLWLIKLLLLHFFSKLHK